MSEFFSKVARAGRRVRARGWYPVDGTTEEQRANMRKMWNHGTLVGAGMALYLEFISLYLVALGASAAVIGIRSSLISAAMMVAPLLGALLVERTGNRKKIVLVGAGVVVRGGLLLMALLPFIAKGNAAVIIFVAISVAQTFAGQITLPASNSLFGDIVPVAIRGRFLGNRMTVDSVLSFMLVPVSGWLIAQVGGLGGYQLIWFLAAIVGAAGFIFYYARIEEPENAERRSGSGAKGDWREGFAVLWRDKRFVAYCAVQFIWQMGISVAGPFFGVYQLETLGFGADVIAQLATVAAIVRVLVLRLAGTQVDLRGAASITAVTMFLVPLMPVSWVFAKTPFQVGLVRAYGSFAWAGVQVAATPLMLFLTPPAYRSRYIAVLNMSVGLAAVLGPVIGGWLYASYGFDANLWTSAAGRLLGAVCFLALFFVARLKRAEEAHRADQYKLAV